MKLDLLNHPLIKNLLKSFPRLSEKERMAKLKTSIVNKTYQEMLKNDGFKKVEDRQRQEGCLPEFQKVIKDHLAKSIEINKVDYQMGFVEVINKKADGSHERITLDLTTLQ